MRTLPAILLLALVCVSRPAQSDTYPRQTGVDIEHYVFRLSLRDDSDEIVGEATISARLVTAGVTDLALDLASAAAGRGMTVTAVTSAGSPVTFTHAGNRVHLPVPAGTPPGTLVSYTIAYHGVPADGLRLIPNKYGERTAFSENWPNRAREWLPMIDHPYDKATGEFVVTAPARYQVVANGVLVEETDLPGGLRRTHWAQTVPIASWLYALGVARFAVHHVGPVKGVPLQTWVYPQDRDVGFTAFEDVATKAMIFFSEHIGPYSYDKLANVEAAGIGGGTEHATCIFYGERSVDGRPIVGLVAHEIAHQWFGDAVTERDWDDVWLSEGFATYFTLLYTEHWDGRDAFVAGLERSRARVRDLERKLPGTPVIHDNLADMSRVLNQLIYQKGGWTLHMLRRRIGTDAFWSGIREYYRRYRDSNASTPEFLRVMEEASGQELGDFFRQWLNRSGLPQLEGGWTYDAVTGRLQIDLAQTQAGDLFTVPVEIGISFEDGSSRRIERLDLASRSQTFAVSLDKVPSAVVLDPDTWLLMDEPVFTRR
jgi:aminopeptidase N